MLKTTATSSFLVRSHQRLCGFISSRTKRTAIISHKQYKIVQINDQDVDDSPSHPPPPPHHSEWLLIFFSLRLLYCSLE